MEYIFIKKGLDTSVLQSTVFISTHGLGLALASGEKTAIKYNIGTVEEKTKWMYNE